MRAWTYIAALDVHHARIVGRCEAKNGIAPFDRLVEQVMTRPPYNDARRVFWIVERLLDFQYYWEATARPFEWKFTRHDLVCFLSKLSAQN